MIPHAPHSSNPLHRTSLAGIMTRFIASLALLAMIMGAPLSKAANAEEGLKGWWLNKRFLPLPEAASPQLQESIRTGKKPDVRALLLITPQDARGWKVLQTINDAPIAKRVPERAASSNVTIEEAKIAGVRVFRVTPHKIAPQHKDHLFLHVHGGAFVFNGGLAATPEAILIAARARIPVISVDYRMLPDHPFPAALEDVTAVYQALIRTHAPEKIAMGGTSAGAGLTLAAMLHFKKLGLPLPAALFLGTPWADLSKTGDSFHLNAEADRTLVAYEGVLAAAARLYANGRSLKDPEISPLYGDFSGLPPALVASGTRDLFLSLAVRVHRRLRDAGIPAELHVFEGLSHGEYIPLRDIPESRALFAELSAFLSRHLK